ncbi:MAG: hypothetical protein Tsb0016_02780 [Sphingomonadales bacterium]
MKYRAEIDGLRALAVLPVVFFHAGMSTFSGGYVGVDVFFVISGYLITTIIINELQLGQFSIARFYERRARRILPALVTVVVACLPFAWLWLLPRDMRDFAESVMAVATFSSNILFWQESGYFDTAAELKPLLHTWSLAVEEQYYILFPLFLMLLWKWNRSLLVPALLLLFGLSLAVAHWGAYNKPPAAFFLLPTRGWELLLGGFCAVYLQKPREHPPLLNQVGGILGLGLIAWAVLKFDHTTPTPSLYTALPCLGTALIILCARTNSFAGILLSAKPLVGIGLISYSAYLWHQPLLAFTRYKFTAEQYQDWLWFNIFATFILAFLSWKFIENPARGKAVFKNRSQVFIASGLALAVLLAIGASLVTNQGMMQRYPEPTQRIFTQYSAGRDYATAHFGRHELKPFAAEESRRKVLLIGDSMAKDIANTLYESGMIDTLDLSTYDIPAGCGNLFLDASIDSIAQNRDPHLCGQGYDHPDLLIRLREAEEIWLASAWTDWDHVLLPASVEKLKDFSNANILVFGRKHVGPRSLDDYHAGGIAAMLGVKAVSPNIAAVLAAMAKQIPSHAAYIDVQKLLCDDYHICGNRTDRGLPVSYDGGHLTPDGARYLGDRLRPLLTRP